MLADVNFPGWTVSVDGLEQPLLRANRIFRAVRLAPGEHRVSFEYKPLSFRLGGQHRSRTFQDDLPARVKVRPGQHP